MLQMPASTGPNVVERQEQREATRSHRDILKAHAVYGVATVLERDTLGIHAS